MVDTGYSTLLQGSVSEGDQIALGAALVETPAEPAPLPEHDEPPVHAPVPPPRPVFAPPPGPPKPKTPLWMRLA